MTIFRLLATMIPLAGICTSATPISGNLTTRASGPFPIENGWMTEYYDGLFHKIGNRCGKKEASPPWPVSEQISWTKCQRDVNYETAPWLWALQTDRIVAIDGSLLDAEGGIQEWCGKEVRITKPNGEIFEFSEGPLFVWDGCAACSSGGIDVSVPVLLDATGWEDQMCGKAEGFKIEVLDNNIWDPPPPLPDAYNWKPPNDVGQYWDKWTKDNGNSWTKAQKAFYAGEAFTLPNGEKVAASPSKIAVPPDGAVSPASSTGDTTAVAQQGAQETGDDAQTASSVTVAPGNGVGAGCIEKGLRSCSEDGQWLLMCNYVENGRGLTWEQTSECPAGCAVSAEGTLESCA